MSTEIVEFNDDAAALLPRVTPEAEARRVVGKQSHVSADNQFVVLVDGGPDKSSRFCITAYKGARIDEALDAMQRTAPFTIMIEEGFEVYGVFRDHRERGEVFCPMIKRLGVPTVVERNTDDICTLSVYNARDEDGYSTAKVWSLTADEMRAFLLACKEGIEAAKAAR